jgi:hypothetical protein
MVRFYATYPGFSSSLGKFRLRLAPPPNGGENIRNTGITKVQPPGTAEILIPNTNGEGIDWWLAVSLELGCWSLVLFC